MSKVRLNMMRIIIALGMSSILACRGCENKPICQVCAKNPRACMDLNVCGFRNELDSGVEDVSFAELDAGAVSDAGNDGADDACVYPSTPVDGGCYTADY